MTTKIEWTEETWNPVTGCSHVSPGCENCYAERMAPRLVAMGQDGYTSLPWTAQNAAQNVVLRPERLDQPLRWTKPRRIFVNSMSDLFHERIPDEFIDRVFAVMALADWHCFQVLSKRPSRMQEYMQRALPRIAALRRDDGEGNRQEERHELQGGISDSAPQTLEAHLEWPLPNVWLGVSVEDQRRADERIPLLLQTPAAVRWLSCEPLLGPVELTNIRWLEFRVDCLSQRYGRDGWSERAGAKIDWCVVGGESGPGARPMHPVWARSLRDQCVAERIPFFFKQWGCWYPSSNRDGEPRRELGLCRTSMGFEDGQRMWRGTKAEAGRYLDGHIWDEYPS